MLETYYCLECGVAARMTREEALLELAEGHTLFQDERPMPVADALADAATLREYLRTLPPHAFLLLDSATHCAFLVLLGDDVETVGTAAIHSARDAFRSCPELRA